MTPGRIVHVRIGGSDGKPELRAAVVTRVNGDGTVNATVFLDGANDDELALPTTRRTSTHAWLQTLHEGKGVGWWRWPEREAAAARPAARQPSTRKTTGRKGAR